MKVAETKKRATQKALSTFKFENEIDEDFILSIIEELAPSKYYITDKDIDGIIYRLFKEYDEISRNEVKELLSDEIIGNTLNVRTNAEIHERDLGNELTDMMYGIYYELQASKKDIRLSSRSEWRPELKEYMERHYGGWSRMYVDGRFSLGMAFYKVYNYIIFDHVPPPFHCYMTRDGNDVLFTYTQYQWIERFNAYSFELTEEEKNLFNGYTPMWEKVLAIVVILSVIMLFVMAVLR